ncbi:MAG: enoyl-CoA hydratase/isomerase family protein [Chloroflexi bacterium]|nr:MAG: enoyl-CoA hydratase/isomerase family protein [Chloroflexota bacterium]
MERGARRRRAHPGRDRDRGRAARIAPTLGLSKALSEIPTLEHVLVATRGHVATVTLNRPEQRNPLSAGMLRDLVAAFRWCQGEDAVRVVVLTGAGDRAFSAGADLSSFEDRASEDTQHRERRVFIELFIVMTQLGKPIVGRINGHALAGGMGLAGSCDVLVAVDTATFATPEINVGVWPMMIQAILARNIPRKVLLEMLMLGERFTAIQMQSVGFVNRVVARELLDATVADIADKLAKKSPIVMRLGRDAFYQEQDMDFEPALDYLYGELLKVAMTEDAKEGVRAFFEKREPEFKGT